MSQKKFSPAEKYRVAIEAIKGELTQAQITAKYQVHSTQISKWRKQALEHMQTAFSNKQQVSNIKHEHEEQLSELYRQVGQLKVENDFLKKNVIRSCSDCRRLWLCCVASQAPHYSNSRQYDNFSACQD